MSSLIYEQSKSHLTPARLESVLAELKNRLKGRVTSASDENWKRVESQTSYFPTP